MNRQTPLSADTGPADGKSDRFPSQIKYIIGNEAAERFGYYGVVGILELYMAKKMGMSDAQATETLAIFGSAVYFRAPQVLGGFLKPSPGFGGAVRLKRPHKATGLP